MGTVIGARPPNQVAYYVALGGIIVLLLLLCCYFFYFFIKRVKELARQEYSTPAPQSAQPPAPPQTTSYPVQPVVRDGASAMAKLCRQLPSQPVGGTVFPTSTSPTPPISKLPAPIISAPPNKSISSR
ncbi:uncharacterized protein ACR2FA_008804 [Aphomia sociella]